LVAARDSASRMPELAGGLCWRVGVGLMTGDDAVEGIVDESRWVRKYAVVDAGGAFEVEE
jgi:hypothetical protein